jgi:hypothetical protein
VHLAKLPGVRHLLIAEHLATAAQAGRFAAERTFNVQLAVVERFLQGRSQSRNNGLFGSPLGGEKGTELAMASRATATSPRRAGDLTEGAGSIFHGPHNRRLTDLQTAANDRIGRIVNAVGLRHDEGRGQFGMKPVLLEVVEDNHFWASDERMGGA